LMFFQGKCTFKIHPNTIENTFPNKHEMFVFEVAPRF
jgi:hypothetical protein